MDAKQDKILTAAFRLFHQHGFKKVTMSDIAEAAAMSRPTLYAVFPNKEAVFEALGAQHLERADAELATRLPKAKTLEAKLVAIFDLMIVGPFASVIDSPNGRDMLASSAVYAPAHSERFYIHFEKQILAVLAPEMPGKRSMSAKDVAHILTLATKGLKATTATLAELRRLIEGLIAMAVITAQGR